MQQRPATNRNFRRTLSASTLVGSPVYNAEGKNLGNVKEIMLDVVDGRIAYSVLSFGGFLGIGDKLLAIPWQAFGVDEENETLLLNVDEETLLKAEGFDPDNWPDTTDPEWGRRIHRHYGYEPYWDR